MKTLLLLLFAGLLLAGCSHEVSPPTPLPVEEIPTAFGTVFAKSGGSAKDLAAEVVNAVKASDYPRAFSAIQPLAAVSGLTAQQTFTVARAQLTLNGLLKSAQAQGDTNATQALEDFRRSK